MPEAKPNPLVAHVLGALQDRSSAEAAKLEALLTITRRLDEISAGIRRLVELEEERERRARR